MKSIFFAIAVAVGIASGIAEAHAVYSNQAYHYSVDCSQRLNLSYAAAWLEISKRRGLAVSLLGLIEIPIRRNTFCC